MITLYNDIHNTQITIEKNIGDEISKAYLHEIESHLCGVNDCPCGGVTDTGDVCMVHQASSGDKVFIIAKKGYRS